jgi:hypothetical protein
MIGIGKPTLEVVGNQYRFRRRQAHHASIECVERRIARGWLVHNHTSDDVEVYDIQPGSPGYIRTISPDAYARIDQGMDDAIEAVLREDWPAYRVILEDLAVSVKRTGFGRRGWDHVVTWMERQATARTDNPMTPELMRQGLRDTKGTDDAETRLVH